MAKRRQEEGRAPYKRRGGAKMCSIPDLKPLFVSQRAKLTYGRALAQDLYQI